MAVCLPYVFGMYDLVAGVSGQTWLLSGPNPSLYLTCMAGIQHWSGDEGLFVASKNGISASARL
jgi:hypothetical protein